MFNPIAARKNMIDSQILTNGVTDQHVIDAIAHLPREKFVPEPFSHVAYVDSPLRIKQHRYLDSPMLLARMLQAAELTPSKLVLDLASGTGYSTAVIAKLAKQVIAVEPDSLLASLANTTLHSLGIYNASIITDDPSLGYCQGGPYDAIIVHGAFEYLPEELIGQLNQHGRIVFVKQSPSSPIGTLMVAIYTDGTLVEHPIFEASMFPLPKFQA